jgi:hypothetical protein
MKLFSRLSPFTESACAKSGPYFGPMASLSAARLEHAEICCRYTALPLASTGSPREEHHGSKITLNPGRLRT